MNRCYPYLILSGLLYLAAPVCGQVSERAASERTLPAVISYSPGAQQPVRLLFDYYHHGLPSTKVGSYITTGSWVDNNGRYGWDDFVHTNTMDHAYIVLAREYAVSMSRQPFTKQLLKETDGVVIVAADNPAFIPSARLIADAEIKALQEFVRDGGSLMVMVNGGGAGRFSESFESVQLKKLVNGFGLAWNDDDTHYSDVEIARTHPYFYDVPVFHYGAGCTIDILPGAVRPEILMEVYSDSGYPDRSVKGPGIVMVRQGKGKFILVGDAGSWTGNLSRPWAENERVLKQLFRYMKPDKGVAPADYGRFAALSYDMTVAGLQAVPVANSLSSVARPAYRMFSPRETTHMPYVEASALIGLTLKAQTDDRAFSMQAAVEDFKWFGQSSGEQAPQRILFDISRQGKVSGILPEGRQAQWISPDISCLSALLPAEGLAPGDRWASVEYLRIPALRGTDLPSVRPLEMELSYVGDVEAGGRRMRLLRASGERWLSDLGVSVADILPEEEIKSIGNPHYRFFHERGGKLLYKREQWVDPVTGIVTEAKVQIRLIAWIQDVRKPEGTSNAARDNEMIVSLAHITNFKLRP